MAPRPPRSRSSDDLRSDARERALVLLYEAETKGLDPADVLAGQVITPDELTRILVEGVGARRADLDAVIARHSRGWTLERMPVIDRTVLRIAGFELLARPEVPVAVILDQAIELVKRFSTDESGRFVNGVLAAMVPELREG